MCIVSQLLEQLISVFSVFVCNSNSYFWIVVACTIDFKANIEMLIALSPCKLAASIALEATTRFLNKRGWNVIVIEIGSQLAARIPFEMAMQNGVKGLCLLNELLLRRGKGGAARC